MQIRHAFLFFLPILILFAGCSNESEVVSEPQIRPVKYAVVGPNDKARTYSFAGTAKSSVEAKLSFRSGGQIESLSVKAGDKVRKGQLIATLDNRDAALAYEQAKASLENARVQKANAQSNLTRLRQLYQSNNVSLADYEQAKNGFATANASFESAQKSLDLQARQLGYNKLFAPAAGVVTAVNNEVNEVVQAGAAIVVINMGKDLELEIGMPETYISQVKKGDLVTAHFSSVEGKIFKGKVSEISFALDASKSTYPVTVMLLEGTEDVRPGMSGDVQFQFGKKNKDSRLVVPVKAVGEGTAGNFVFVIQGAEKGVGTVHKQAVKIGKLLPGGFAVESGLSEGTTR